MTIDFGNVFLELESMGLFDVMLPFLLVFSIAFSVINKTKIFGDKKGVDVIVALVLAFLAVRSRVFVGLMKSFLPNVAMFMIIILMFLMMLGIFAGEKKEWKGVALGLGALVSFIFILFALFFDYTTNYVEFPYWLRDLFYGIDDRTKGIILFIGVLVIVIWIATREKPSDKSESLVDRFIKGIGGG